MYTGNSGTGGGVIGGILGLPLIQAAGLVGARIVVVLLLFVAVMILTGTTLIGLFRTIKRPVDMVSEGLETARQRREEERLILERDAQIDVPLEDRMPAHPVRSEAPAPLFPPPPEKKKKEKKNDKLERLKAAFGVDDPGAGSYTHLAALDAHLLQHGQNHVLGRNPGGKFARQIYFCHLRHIDVVFPAAHGHSHI